MHFPEFVSRRLTENEQTIGALRDQRFELTSQYPISSEAPEEALARIRQIDERIEKLRSDSHKLWTRHMKTE